MPALVPRPPLRLSFTVQYDHKVSWFPVADDQRVFIGAPEGVRALEEGTGAVLWQSRAQGFPLGVDGGTLFVRRLTDDLSLVCLDAMEAASGRFQRTVLESPSMSRTTTRGGTLVFATSHEGKAICALGMHDGAVRWRWPLPDPRGAWGHLATDGDAVYAMFREGPLVALDFHAGQALWRHSLSDLAWTHFGEERPGQARADSAATVIGDNVLYDAEGGWIVALNRMSGERAWTYRADAPVTRSAVHGGLYHVLLTSGEFVTVDPVDGRVVSSVNLDRKVPRPTVRISRPALPLLVSDTHVFTGSDEGFVLAFERPKGKYVWSLRPKGAGTTNHDGNRFVSAGGRLYYSDMALRLYCLEEDRSETVDTAPAAAARGSRRRG